MYKNMYVTLWDKLHGKGMVRNKIHITNIKSQQ